MEKATRICKICGIEYPYCKTNRPSEVFRWQDVACCPEHGAMYFDKVMEARGEKVLDEQDPVEQEEPKRKTAPRKKKVQE